MESPWWAMQAARIIFFIVFFLTSCGGGGGTSVGTRTAEADVKVHVLMMDDPLALTTANREAILAGVQDRYAENGLKIKYVAIESINPLPGTDSLEKHASEENTETLERFLADNGYRDRRVIYYAFFPPMLDVSNGNLVVAGRACGICSYRREVSCAHGNAEDFRSNGKPILEFQTVLMAHELGHVIGMTHKAEVPNIMHPSALSFTSERLEFLPESIEQARGCLVQRRRQITRRIQRKCSGVRNKKRCARRIRRGVL